MVRRVKIHGERGRWVAEVEGRWLAVLHNTHRIGSDRHFAPFDQGDPRGSKRYDEFVAALQDNDLVVMQRDRSPDDFTRDGYVGVFRFADLKIDYTSGISLRLAERYADPN